MIFLNWWKYPEICFHPTMMRMKNVMKPKPWEWLHGAAFPNLDHYLNPWEWAECCLQDLNHICLGKYWRICAIVCFLSRILWHEVFFENLNWGCVACWEAARSNDLPARAAIKKVPEACLGDNALPLLFHCSPDSWPMASVTNWANYQLLLLDMMASKMMRILIMMMMMKILHMIAKL